MYPVTQGFEQVKQRIESLIINDFYSEALVTSVFTIEKMLRRTLREIIVSAGFTSKNADKIIGNSGLQSIKNQWLVYEPNGKTLVQILGNDIWNKIDTSSQIRNKLVHGIRSYDDSECKKYAENNIALISEVKHKLDEAYNYSGWSRFSIRRKSILHTNPKIKIEV